MSQWDWTEVMSRGDIFPASVLGENGDEGAVNPGDTLSSLGGQLPRSCSAVVLSLIII